MATITGTSGDDDLVGTDVGDTIEGQAGNDTIDGGVGGDVVFGGDGNDVITDTGSPAAGQFAIAGFVLSDFAFTNADGSSTSIPLDAENPGNIDLEDGGTISFSPGSVDETVTLLLNDDDAFFEDGFVEDGATDSFTNLDAPITIGGQTFDAGQIVEAETSVRTVNQDGEVVTFTLITIVPNGATNDQNNGDAVLLVADGPISPTDTFTITPAPGEPSGIIDGPEIPFISLEEPGDSIFGGAGEDSINAGAGSDFVDAGADNDIVSTDAGDDSLFGGDGIDTLDASANTQAVTIDLGADTATGAEIGNDVVDQFENVVGGAGDDTITGDASDNTIDGGAGADTISTGDGNDTIIVGEGDDIVDGGGVSGGDPAVDNDTLVINTPAGGSFDVLFAGGDDEDGTVNILDSDGNTVSTVRFSEIENIVCFTRGTMIATPMGEVAIEDLSEGDMVSTRDSGARSIRWIGKRTVRAEGALAPVKIVKGALGNHRDLMISPLHRLLVTHWRSDLMFGEPEVLVCAKHLVNGDTIFSAPGGDVEYFHILFDNHEIITANGTPAESFHPGEQGLGWLDDAVREEIFMIFPELRIHAEGYGPAARPALREFEARALIH